MRKIEFPAYRIRAPFNSRVLKNLNKHPLFRFAETFYACMKYIQFFAQLKTPNGDSKNVIVENQRLLSLFIFLTLIPDEEASSVSTV